MAGGLSNLAGVQPLCHDYTTNMTRNVHKFKIGLSLLFVYKREYFDMWTKNFAFTEDHILFNT